MHAAPEEPDVATDARNRALRTLVQQLALDVLAAVALVLVDNLTAEHVDWRLLGLAVGKTALSTAASYVYRYLRPPATA